MCGRYFLNAALSDLAMLFDIPLEGNLAPRYNIAPSQPVLALRNNEQDARELSVLQWGLVPPWRKELPEKPMINARIETVLEKPSFRAAYRHRRCLIPASGFFEWKNVKTGKQPYRIGIRNSPVIAFAGIWECWTGPGGDSLLETAAILTKSANPAIAPIHHRMPVILAPDEFSRWMGEETPRPEMIAHLAGYPDKAYEPIPVSRHVSNARNDDPRCIEPASINPDPSPAARQPSLF